MDIIDRIPRVIGTEINYYLICHKKLWFFTRNITMEQNSGKVEIGKILHEDSFSRKKKEILIDGTIMVDFSDEELTIHETKSTNAMDDASRYQVLYYLYYLEKKGITGVTGIVHYYKNRDTERLMLTDKDRARIDEIVRGIEEIKNSLEPPVVEKMKICKNCSYYELCYC